MDISKLLTEKSNPASLHLDEMSSLEIAALMNKEDGQVLLAVNKVLPLVAKAIDIIVGQLRQGGRLFYIGAGTSGRLGVLDASECPPTFSVPAGLVVGLIAGGDTALRKAIEGAEDSPTQAAKDLQSYGFNSKDVLVGLAASGRTPYVLGALEYARSLGSRTIAISCTEGAAVSSRAEIALELLVGPEILTGSTRLKAGTAQKLVLNMLSTATMVQLGKCYKNLMVDVQPTNEKLRLRAENMIMEIAGVQRLEAQKALEQTKGNVKLALVLIMKDCSLAEAERRLNEADGKLALALRM